MPSSSGCLLWCALWPTRTTDPTSLYYLPQLALGRLTEQRGAKVGPQPPSPAKPPAAAAPPKEAEWKMIALIAGATGIITMSGSTMLTCTALFLQARLKWSELKLGFVMMAQGAIGFGVQVVVFPACTKTFGILVRDLLFLVLSDQSVRPLNVGRDPIRDEPYLGYGRAVLLRTRIHPLVGRRLAGPRRPAGSDNLGRVIGIGAMVQSCGRILGPLILGAAGSLDPIRDRRRPRGDWRDTMGDHACRRRSQTRRRRRPREEGPQEKETAIAVCKRS